MDDLSFASVRFEFPPDTQYHGSYVSYYNNDNGQLCRKGHYKDGNKDGPWVGYYYDGQLMDNGHYKDGNKDGPWVSYHVDGAVDEKDTGTYKDGVKID